jgi:hypothetical protein
MNDKIKELIFRLEPDAFMTYKGYLYHSGDPKVLEHSDPEPLYTRQELVKLTEAIVRECCEVLREEVEVALSADGDVVYPEGLIRKHFGVTE